MNDANARPAVSSSVCYRDPVAALKWLETAFGFDPRVVVTSPDGKIVHAELGYREGVIGVGDAWSPDHAAPVDIGGKNTQSVHIQLQEDVDAHYSRAQAAGATIVRPLATQSYGDRTYVCKDLEGHVWSFGQTVRAMSEEDWDRELGTTTRKSIQEIER
ncbi:MAG TPA: VOC family protein [Phenylobacterium sp.]